VGGKQVQWSSTAKVISNSVEHTERVGEYIGQTVPAGGRIFLYGDLAAGKTAFVRGFVRHFSPARALDVHSPTYAFMHTYQTTPPIYHLDLYRVESRDAFFDLGLDDALDEDRIACIEWPREWMGPDFGPSLSVYFKSVDGDRRELSFHFNDLPTLDLKVLEKII